MLFWTWGNRTSTPAAYEPFFESFVDLERSWDLLVQHGATILDQEVLHSNLP
jgi:hypothetical protein